MKDKCKLHLGKKKVKKMGSIMQDLIIWMTLLVKSDYIEKL